MKRFAYIQLLLCLTALLLTLSAQISVQAQQNPALTGADTALFNGDYATAVAQYTSAANDPASKCDALYGLGVTQFRAEDYQDAETAFSNQLSGCAPTFEALVMNARALQALGKTADAFNAYQQAQKLKPGLIDSYLDEQMAALDPDQAVYFLRLATEAQRDPEDEFTLRQKLAEIYAAVGSSQSALTEYNTLLQEIDSYLGTLSKIPGADYDKDGSFRASIELAAADIEMQEGQTNSAYLRLQRIITNYQSAPSALQALIDLVQDGQTVDLLNRMRINVNNQNYQPVVSVLTDYLGTDGGTAPAELYLLLGKAQRGLGDATSALATFATLRQKYPNDPLASTAALEQGNTDLQTGDYDKAVAAFSEVAATYPQSPEAPQAILSAAETEYSHGDTAKAISLYDQLGKTYPTSDEAKTGLLEAALEIRTDNPSQAADFFARVGTAEGFVWEGKVLQQGNNPGAAKQAWQKALSVESGTFFSTRACELLNGLTSMSNLPLTTTTNPAPDPAAAAQWVSQAFNLPNTSPDLSPDLANDPMLQRGVELWKLGLWNEARAELDNLHKLHRDDPAGLLQLALYYQTIPIYRSSLLAATRLIYSTNQSLLSIPDAVLRLAFPLDYADLIIPASQQNNLDPLLVFALIRQESSFDPTVDSSADARGLMQFVPATAQDVANQLQWPNYTLDDLYRANVATAFGTHYLASMRDFQNGSDIGAVLSYNAGPGIAQTWLSQSGNDLDTLYEIVGYSESKSYLDFIYTNHFVYQHLYTANPPTCSAS
ncbi:MAG TPA: transglycosylase SLT domain-containing protein [Phototrophicaceae bacterium]|nr:transglycosylase SLT domain-containing protein [Phototrophicaceae bacterium]